MFYVEFQGGFTRVWGDLSAAKRIARRFAKRTGYAELRSRDGIYSKVYRAKIGVSYAMEF